MLPCSPQELFTPQTPLLTEIYRGPRSLFSQLAFPMVPQFLASLLPEPHSIYRGKRQLEASSLCTGPGFWCDWGHKSFLWQITLLVSCTWEHCPVSSNPWENKQLEGEAEMVLSHRRSLSPRSRWQMRRHVVATLLLLPFGSKGEGAPMGTRQQVCAELLLRRN